MYTRRDKRMFELYDPLDSLYRICMNWFRKRRAARWPGVNATIRQARAFVVDGETGRTAAWYPVVVYEYEINGVSYQGKMTGEIWYYENDAATETAASLIGASLPVRYKPSNPSKSLYLPDDGGPPQLLPARPGRENGLVTVSLK